MSLDVYLEEEDAENLSVGSGIFVREGGQTKEISRLEWDERYPGREPIAVEASSEEVYHANITHNLSRMADEAGIYEYLWRPEEVGVFKAGQLIEPLTDGLALLNSNPERFEVHNPENGWGDYEALKRFVAGYLIACRVHPEAKVSVWR